MLKLSQATLTMVDSEASFHSMQGVLQHAKVMALDLEHHHTFSFHGFVCLLQVSVENHDFLIGERRFCQAPGAGPCTPWAAPPPTTRRRSAGA